MEKVVSKVAAMGVPGLVLLCVMAGAKAAGLVGAAVLTKSLSILGGPVGMIGGIAVLGLIGLISQSFIEYGAEAVIKAVVKENLKTKTAEEIKMEVDNMRLISKSLKLKIKDYIDNSTKN